MLRRAVLLGCTSAAALTALWPMQVEMRRGELPSGRKLEFFPGSTDDVIAENLQSGDIVAFDRRPTLYSLPQAARIAAYKVSTGSRFDHVAVVVRGRSGAPYVLEQTASGIKLRPYAARIRCSHAREVVVRRIDAVRDAASDAAARAAAKRLCEEDDGAAGALLGVGDTSQSTATVAAVWHALGWLPSPQLQLAAVDVVNGDSSLPLPAEVQVDDVCVWVKQSAL
eukprot:PLAT15814.2.p1 GENE.PLAT15814.2~~PLAT15814.2.p1  ORF type:complete len:235 (-),score=70.57 PLAT15814.2:154-828(-)